MPNLPPNKNSQLVAIFLLLDPPFSVVRLKAQTTEKWGLTMKIFFFPWTIKCQQSIRKQILKESLICTSYLKIHFAIRARCILRLEEQTKGPLNSKKRGRQAQVSWILHFPICDIWQRQLKLFDEIIN